MLFFAITCNIHFILCPNDEPLSIRLSFYIVHFLNLLSPYTVASTWWRFISPKYIHNGQDITHKTLFFSKLRNSIKSRARTFGKRQSRLCSCKCVCSKVKKRIIIGNRSRVEYQFVFTFIPQYCDL